MPALAAVPRLTGDLAVDPYYRWLNKWFLALQLPLAALLFWIGTATGAGGPMSKSEALRLLGLQLGAGADEIRAAHRRKLQEHHPDRGGDPDMAARINQARDVLIAG